MVSLSSFILRRYEERDFIDLTRLYRDFYGELRDWQEWAQCGLDDKEAEEITREILDSNSVIFVAENCGELVGFTRIQIWDGAYFVREVFIDKEFRRRGIGSGLLTICEDHVRENGETSIFLTVEPTHSISIKYLISNGYDTLNMLELRKDLTEKGTLERQNSVEILGHEFQLLKRKPHAQ